MTGFLDTTASVVSVHQGLQQHDSATTLDLPGHSKGVHAKPPMLDQQTLREYGMLAKRAGSITSTLASRETSPERGSIASFRITSRPGTASGYDAANVKKMYLGEPLSPRCKLHIAGRALTTFVCTQLVLDLSPPVIALDLVLRQVTWLPCFWR